jgi:phospholipid/cholesterol/gamma-HCH transport system substrate-binding protein
MHARTRDVIVGLTALFGVLGVAAMLLMFGELRFLDEDVYEFTLVVPDAAGVAPGADVLVNGVPVGRVDATTAGLDPGLGVEIAVLVNRGVRIPREAGVAVEQGFLDGASLEFRVPVREDGAAPLSDDAYIQQGDRIRASAAGLIEQIAGLLDSRLEPLAETAESVNELAQTYTRVGERVEALLAERTAADVDAGATPSLASALERLDTALASANVWLDDEGLRGETRATVAEARATFARLGEAAERWSNAATTLTSTAEGIGEDLDEGVIQFQRATRSLGETLEEVRLLAARANSGEGTFGQLVANPDLYRSLNDAALRLDRALLEAQLLLERYRKDGIPIDF